GRIDRHRLRLARRRDGWRRVASEPHSQPHDDAYPPGDGGDKCPHDVEPTRSPNLRSRVMLSAINHLHLSPARAYGWREVAKALAGHDACVRRESLEAQLSRNAGVSIE